MRSAECTPVPVDALAAAGACLTGTVVLGHAAALAVRVGRLVPAVTAGFALQTLTGSLTYLLPVVFGRGAWGNRRLSGILELAWPLRVAAINLRAEGPA